MVPPGQTERSVFSMQPRLNFAEANPAAYRAMASLETYVRGSSLDPVILELVKVRASQINGCAFCIHMHTKEAMQKGERPERLLLLSAWRESPFYTEKERAALGWTEALTLLSQTGAPDKDYAEATRHFGPKELVDLTTAICLINAWNRLAVGFRSVHPVD
jgi:AhpD family alkylhydroperoxidase